MRRKSMRNAWLGILALLFVLSAMNLTPCNDVIGEQGKTIKPMYAPHVPCNINSNAELIASPCKTGGSGTQTDPYRIEGWDINGTGTGYALYIGNVTVYFVVKNNYLHHTTGSWNTYFEKSGLILYNTSRQIVKDNVASYNDGHGIFLFYAINVNVTNNTANNNHNYGLVLDSSSYNNITKNTARSNSGIGLFITDSNNNHIIGNDAQLQGYGMHIMSANYNVISNNDLSNNSMWGLDADSSNHNTLAFNNVSNNGDYGFAFGGNNNTISNNIVSKNRYGILMGNTANDNIVSNNTIFNDTNCDICLWESSRNTLVNNTMMNGGVSVSGYYLYQWNTHNIDTSNHLNGKKVYYYKNQIGGIVSSDAAQVIIANSNNMIVEGLAFKDVYIAIDVGFSTNTTIKNNDISGNSGIGISVFGSKNDIISYNNASGIEAGIAMTYSRYESIENNDATSGKYGMIISDTMHASVKYNNVSYSQSIGILVDSSWNYYNDIRYNNASNCLYGIYISDNNEYNNITNNILSYDDYGIYLEDQSSLNNITNNVILHGSSGIYIRDSWGNLITNNVIRDMSSFGIYLGDVETTTITSNDISDISQYGIYFVYSKNNVISYNEISYGGSYGIKLNYSATGNRIHHNNLIDNNVGNRQAWDDAGSNQWNDAAEGNYWYDFDTPGEGCWDNNTNGICDAPYLIDGGKNVKDFYPITTPVVHEFRGEEMTLLVMVLSVLLTYSIKRGRDS